MHSIHYLDWIRAVLGKPHGVYARTVPHPDYPKLTSTRTAVIVNYSDRVRCRLSINHNFKYGPKRQAATICMEGSRGAAVATLGVMPNYPDGEPDRVEVIAKGSQWTEVPLEGDWFPDVFLVSMSNLQRFATREDPVLLTGTEDAYHTMALVEACYQSDSSGGTPVPE